MRRLGIIVSVVAIVGQILPWNAAVAQPETTDQMLALMNSNRCGARSTLAMAPAPTVTPSASASPGNTASPETTATPVPSPTPTFPTSPTGPVQLYATPLPSPGTATPLPVPTNTPGATPNNSPVFLIRPSGSPPPIPPAGSRPTAEPSPTPSAVGPTPIPTLEPGYIAVMADQVSGNTNAGQPGEASGNVNIFYQDGILVGDKAHYDGQRTMIVTGHPYIINREQNSILHADTISFDTVSRLATLQNTRGESTQGIEKGEVYYTARDMTSTSGGVAHGNYASVTTCANPRAGYHITGRTIDVKPGDRLTITKAVLFLGAVAIFYLPKVVIPLRQVDDVRKPTFFPEFGYNQYEGFYVKAKLGFGHDDYYYGYYRVNYFSKVGLGLGYVGFFAKRNGRRSANVDYYGIKDRRTGTQSYNLTANEVENFSRTLRGNFNFSYNGNYGPYTFLPPSTAINAVVAHATAREQQSYTLNRSAIGTQSNVYNIGFTDQHQLTQNLSQGIAISYNTSQTTYGGTYINSESSHINTLTHLTTRKYDLQLVVDKSNANAPSGINKLPELQVRPNSFFPHFRMPLSAQFYLGRYEEPQDNFQTSRADLAFTLGPALFRIFGSDFSAGGTVEQFAYGTGDLKAKITQNLSLSTPIGKHFVNSITYNESNNNGPAVVPFQAFDILSTQNTHAAYEVARFFNRDNYNLQISTSTFFSGQAQPFTYQLISRPSRRSQLSLGGSFSPGSGLGFNTTNLQLATPFGRNADLQFITDIDWKNKGRLANKNIYYHRVIGDCYEIRLQYNQSLKQVNVTLNLLAFPSRSASFGVGKNGPILPGGLNF
ncbi:MAG: hypothetical protein M3N19_08595 [Candidatus Eremiobacteraeota bacterium]|nr:hypothetical protein [Candidatus Eremiobacteraeota bacterium]